MYDRQPNRLTEYATGGFAEVFGWGMNEHIGRLMISIDEFQKRQGISGPLVEIGVQDGRVLILLALMSLPAEVTYGIDIFENQSENLDRSGVNTSYDRVLANLRQHADGAAAELIRANSFRIPPKDLEKLRNFRLMHIDGGHYFEVVMNDLDIAMRHISGGGVIILDDYWHAGFPEVQEAVHRYFWTSPVIKAAPFMVGSNKLFLASHEIRHDLIEFMKTKLPENFRKPVKVLGYDAITCDAQW